MVSVHKSTGDARHYAGLCVSIGAMKIIIALSELSICEEGHKWAQTLAVDGVITLDWTIETQVRLLRDNAVLATWAAWHFGVRWILSGANLSGASLSGANFSGADLSEANLSRADLRGADFSRADLRGANLLGASLRWADLYEADLRGANLRGAYLNGADLRGADIRGANLRGAYLSEAYLSGVIGLERVCRSGKS